LLFVVKGVQQYWIETDEINRRCTRAPHPFNFPVVEADLAEATLQSGRLTEQQALSRSELAEPRWRRRPEAPKNEPGARVPRNLFANSPTALAHSPSIFNLLCAARGMPAEEEANDNRNHTRGRECDQLVSRANAG
jgi:hypothetical protein